jgi:hypothetical protein
MTRFLLVLLVVLAVVVVGSLVFLATWDIPPPSTRVEKAIPNEKIGK